MSSLLFTCRWAACLTVSLGLAAAQDPAAAPAPAPPQAESQEPPKAPSELSKRTDAEPGEKAFTVEKGTRIPLSMINSISTKSASDGDKIYLETVFPILAQGRVVIPPGSYVSGTVTHIKRPGKVKGRGEFYLRFDALTLPNGTTRDFRASLQGLDGRAAEDLDKKEGKIQSEGNKGGDARTVGEVAMAGTGIGALAGSAMGSVGMGAGIGAAAGAAGALVGVLLSRGPDAILAKGTTVELVLDRQLKFAEAEIDFTNQMPRATNAGSGPMPSQRTTQRQGRFPY